MLNLRSNISIVPLSNQHAEKTAGWVQNQTVRENIGLRSEPSLEKTVRWIEQAAKDTSISAFAIIIDEVHIGNTILDKHDVYLATARFSIYIGEQSTRRSGVGRTATYQICKYGFDKLSLHKIWLTVHSQNFSAINTYNQVGFELEGVLKEEFLLNDKRLSAFYMGLLKNDFEKLETSFI